MIASSFNAALESFGVLGYASEHGPQFTPGGSAPERNSFAEMVLVGRFREAIRRLISSHTPHHTAQHAAAKAAGRGDKQN